MASEQLKTVLEFVGSARPMYTDAPGTLAGSKVLIESYS